MDDALGFRIVDGFPADQRSKAAAMFWEAFRGKLHRLLGPEAKALHFIEAVLDASHAIGAVRQDGALIGVAGFKTADGAFVGGDFAELRSVFGWIGGLWRAGALSLLERPLQRDTLTMDGIMVSAEARGQGVGSALLSAVKAKAVELGCKRVRLDVIDANIRARALYERHGFVARRTEKLGPLRHIVGFRVSTTMVFNV